MPYFYGKIILCFLNAFHIGFTLSDFAVLKNAVVSFGKNALNSP